MPPRHAQPLLILAAASLPSLADTQYTPTDSGSRDREDRYNVVGRIEASWVHARSDLPSWLHYGNGKLRFDEDHDGLNVNRVFLDYRGRIGGTVSGRVVVNVNSDGGAEVDFTDAYLEWRPVPKSAWRLRGRLGAFYPRLSLENVDAGWSNAYALSNSVINTWIAEELRTVGAELRLVRDLPGWPDQQLALEGTVFSLNDPVGASLTWRGWAAHDRQTGITGSIPMPAVSTVEPWATGGNPLAHYGPYAEIDGRAGFSAGVQWRWGERAMIKAFHYDNRGDPEATSGAEYAWQTRFTHIGAQISLPLGVGLLGQWIDGTTVMGPDLGPWHVQDVLFDSSFAMLTRSFGDQRVSLRYEWFDLQPFNDPPGITNQDRGNAVALAWIFQATPRIRLGAEYLQIRSDHCKFDSCLWTLRHGLPQVTRESQLQVSLSWQFADSSL